MNQFEANSEILSDFIESFGGITEDNLGEFVWEATSIAYRNILKLPYGSEDPDGMITSALLANAFAKFVTEAEEIKEVGDGYVVDIVEVYGDYRLKIPAFINAALHPANESGWTDSGIFHVRNKLTRMETSAHDPFGDLWNEMKKFPVLREGIWSEPWDGIPKQQLFPEFVAAGGIRYARAEGKLTRGLKSEWKARVKDIRKNVTEALQPF